MLFVFSPVAADVFSFFSKKDGSASGNSQQFNSQNMTLLDSAFTGSASPQGGGDTIIIDNALSAESGPLGEAADVITPKNDQISVYVVRSGDSLSQIGEMFGVSVNTIRWANDISSSETIHEGQVLVILPISGVKHEVQSGDTLASITKKYDGNLEEIAQFNGLESQSALAVGDEIIIPHGEVSAHVPSAPSSPRRSPAPAPSHSHGGQSASGISGYFIKPVSGGTRTQGLHGYNGIDLASYHGAEIYAAASGKVIISRSGGWNGGYGNYVVVRHDNGTQTLYAHLNSNLVSVGQQVVQGQVIGYMGSTGRSTGTHLHFEVRGASNPF